ncbi:MAG: hypothetical protein FD120_2826 [Gammaproteobacteria bacterium]|nr:MAG: hypothetical protein FD120_2826 [Gammaproteobacteria bacterium]
MQLKRRAHLEVRPSDSVFSGKPATFVLRTAAYALNVLIHHLLLPAIPGRNSF